MTTEPNPKSETGKNLKIIRVEGAEKPEKGMDYFKILRRIEKAALRQPRHDFVISMTDPPMLARVGEKVAKSMNAKHIHWLMDLYPDLLPIINTNVPKMIHRMMENKIRGAMKNADQIVTISGCMTRNLTHNGIARQKITTIENWPDPILKIDHAEPQDSEPVTKFRILYSGTIGMAHEFQTVIKAAQYLQKALPEVVFVFQGRGRRHQTLAQQVKKLGLENIEFHPLHPKDKMKQGLEKGDVHLITMKPNATGLLFPSKIYAACAVGRPVIFIGPKECDIHDILTKKNCGTSVRNADHQSLIKAITNYMRDANLWFTQSQNAKKYTDDMPDKNLKQWDDLIVSLN